MARFILATQAQADLNSIWEYIADDNSVAADRWVDEMEKKFQALAESPIMGRARDELAPGLRSFPVNRYIIFYPSGSQYSNHSASLG